MVMAAVRSLSKRCLKIRSDTCMGGNEFLGDGVLNMAACVHLMHTESQHKSKGQMKAMLHGLVSIRTLCNAAILRCSLYLHVPTIIHKKWYFWHLEILQGGMWRPFGC